MSINQQRKRAISQKEQSIILSASNVYKKYGQTKALRGASLKVKKGELLAIMGPSGSGKSTLLHAMAGIDTIDSGEIVFNGLSINQLSDQKRTLLRRHNFGFIFQFSQLVPELTALDNVAIPLLLNKVKKSLAYKQAKEWLNKVGLADDKLNKLPSQLSGGQVQRVAVARAMIIKPEILFADEPTGSLDAINSEMVMKMFIQAAKENNTTLIMVTHEPSIAAYADREIIVRDGQIQNNRGLEV